MGFNNRSAGSGIVIILSVAAIAIGIIGWALPVPFKLNFAIKATGSNSINKSILENTFYCTGVTTGSFTTTSASTKGILVTGQLNFENINSSIGVLIQERYALSTAVPSTLFGQGGCANPVVVSQSTNYFPSQAPGTTIYSSPFSATFTIGQAPAGTYYASLDIFCTTIDGTDCKVTVVGVQSSLSVVVLPQ